MLISSKLLNIQKGVSWELEYGLDPETLKLLVSPALRLLLRVVNGQSAYLCLFEDRNAQNIFIGEKILPVDALHNLHELHKLPSVALSSSPITLINKANNNQLFSTIPEFKNHDNIDSCLLISLNDTQENIKGFVCIFGEGINRDVSQIEASSTLFTQCLVNALVAKKYKRLNTDRNEFNQLLVNTHEFPIFAKDTKSKLVFANKAFIDLYPVEKRDKIIGYTTVEDYDEEQRNLFLADDAEAFAKGQKSVIETIDFPNGEQRILETTKRRFKTSTDKEYILGVSYDLTEQSTLINLLRKKNRDLDQVANMLATEVRAPANAMVKLITWIQKDLAHIDNSDVKDDLNEIRERAFKLSKLLTAIYQYCFAGRDHHISTQLSLTSLVADILANINTEKKLVIDIDDSSFKLPRAPLITVLEALIKNAIDHHCDDEVIVDISCTEDKHFYILHISDNGPGIDASHSDSIFNLFESTKNQPGEVTGVGLAIAQKILDSYKGSIYFDKAFCGGAKAIVKWPKNEYKS